MNVLIAIPSGGRATALSNTIALWKVKGFSVAVYAWDRDTELACKGKVNYFRLGNRASYPSLQNLMARQIPNWDVFICGADDIWPKTTTPEMIARAVHKAVDKVIWVKDGLMDFQPTHAIVTRQWYDKHKFIFDECFFHNCCDADLAMRTYKAGELVKCFDIGFEHRHHINRKRKKDELDKEIEAEYPKDLKYFYLKHPEVQGNHKTYLEIIKQCPTITIL